MPAQAQENTGEESNLLRLPAHRRKSRRRIPHHPVALGALLRVNDSIHTDYKPSVYTSPLRTMLAPIRKKCLAPPAPFPSPSHPFFCSFPDPAGPAPHCCTDLASSLLSAVDNCDLLVAWIWRRVCVRTYVCMYLFTRSRPDETPKRDTRAANDARVPSSCLLPDLARGLLQAVVAFLIRPAGAEASTHDGGPCPALKQKD